MPRWEGHTPKRRYSKAELAYMREANRKHRAKLRLETPAISHTERARMGGLAVARKRAELAKKVGAA
jgi:hypothetical protein